jgi:transcriptional regulator with XRE-family HTH domain
MNRAFEDDLRGKLQDPEFAKMFGAAQAKSSFALTLVKAREKLGLRQKELADKADVSQAYIAKLEGGEANPTLERIGSLLGVVGLSLTTDTTTLFPTLLGSVRETPAVETNWDPDSMLIPQSMLPFSRLPVDAREKVETLTL